MKYFDHWFKFYELDWLTVLLLYITKVGIKGYVLDVILGCIKGTRNV